MSRKLYNWKRFWCPRGSNITLDFRGYLNDPDSEFGHICSPNLVPLEGLANIPCLILLGEPGIGKSYAMRDAYEKNCADGYQTLLLDLRSFGSEDRLVRSLFASTEFGSCVHDGQTLCVFLDSLDECLLRIDNLATLLVDELKKYSVEHLYLRIACRTAELPNVLEEGLRGIYGEESVGVYELTPLRYIDVEEAARVNGLDVDSFLHDVSQKEVVPLAFNPNTLNFLINIYKKTGQFPSAKSDLYFQGCELLCDEVSESRQAAGRRGFLSATQRLAVAARIAAVTIFANRYAIWTDVNLGNVPIEDITIRKLSGGSERANGDEFEVSEAAIRETLSTGLFSSRGRNRMGWSHQTYAEFLAAWYLVHHNMSLKQIMSLIVHPGDPDKKLVPQLYETSAWLASMVPDVFKEIMRLDPKILLRSDVATADVSDRANLVEGLLRLYSEERLLEDYLSDYRNYRKLEHAGLAEQLRPYICDTTKNIFVRRVATNIAGACELKALQDDFMEILLDASEPYEIRRQAAYAISGIGDIKDGSKLKPLILGGIINDTEDEIKGCILNVLWPSFLTAEELFSVLTPPKKRTFFGAYQLFIRNDVLKSLQITDLPLALQWVELQLPTLDPIHPFHSLVDGIMLQSLEHLDSPEVLDRFAKVILLNLKHHYRIGGKDFPQQFRELLNNDDGKRQQIIDTIVPLLIDPEMDSLRLIHTETPIVLSGDVPWMIQRLQDSISEDIQQVWARLIEKVFNGQDPEQTDAVLTACQNNSVLAKAFLWLLKPVELSSSEAKEMKERYEYYQEIQKRHEKEKTSPLLEPPPSERITLLLEAFESGDLDAWWQLNREMTLEPDSTHYGNELEPDLTKLPGWEASDDLARARIIRAAKRYVLEQNPETRNWLGTNKVNLPAFAGYRALFLLFKEDPSFILQIPIDVWKRWAPIILAYPIPSGFVEEEPHHELVKVAYKYAPEEIINVLMLLIDKENRELDYIFITRKVEDCWDDRLAKAILDKVKDKKLKPENMGCLLRNLLKQNVAGAKEFAESLISLSLPASGKRRQRAKVAARELMAHAKDAGWSIVWKTIQRDSELGREIILSIAHGFDLDVRDIGCKLTEDQLADLYIWLVCQFPYAEDPEHDGAHVVTPRESVSRFRDSILSYLKQRGSPKACDAIRQIIGELPELDWLKRILIDAQNITRYHTWVPPKPTDIIKLASDQQSRLIQNGDQLLEVLVESLKRFEKKLQGETPAAQFLWDRNKPKDEGVLSDFVKIHLDDDLKQRGVVVNREVQIHRGQRTDIHIDAVMLGSRDGVYDAISAIIEVKGCWNRELFSAMKTQLVEKYLKDNHCQHGLYLVGWYNCDLWDDDDYKKRDAQKLTKDEAQNRFDAQADDLSNQDLKIRALVIDTSLHR